MRIAVFAGCSGIPLETLDALHWAADATRWDGVAPDGRFSA